MTWLWWIGAFAVGFAAEFWSEVWGVKHTNAVNGKYAKVPLHEFKAKVRTAKKWARILLIAGALDVGSVFGGLGAYIAFSLGSVIGGPEGVSKAMWDKYWRLNGGKPEEGEDDE